VYHVLEKRLQSLVARAFEKYDFVTVTSELVLKLILGY